ncbi:hypothetical protein [Arthrobacter sp. TMS1-12-1]
MQGFGPGTAPADAAVQDPQEPAGPENFGTTACPVQIYSSPASPAKGQQGDTTYEGDGNQ